MYSGTKIVLTSAKEHLQAWLDAELAIAAGGQSYTIGTRTLTRANLSEIAEMIKYWQARVNAMENGGGIRLRRVRPLDL